MTDERTTIAALVIEHLTISTPSGRTLLRDASLRINQGEFVLLAGASGSGKTTLLRLIAGIDDPQGHALNIAGNIEVHHPENSREKLPVGVVFQEGALFDELTAAENVQFAVDHRPGPKHDNDNEAVNLLSEMGVAPSRLPSSLSGGERQRVAVARTLALDPPILLFDEPTSGLDSRRAAQVADLIRKTHQSSVRTVIVITHDYLPFLAHEPRIVLLDDDAGTLRDVSSESLDAFFRCEPKTQPAEPPRMEPAGQRPRWQQLPWLERPGEIVWTLLATLATVMGGWTKPRWQLRYLWYYARMVVFGSTLLYVALAGGMLGFVFVLFSFSQLPYTEVIVPLLRQEFLAATGYSTFRIVVPLLTSVLLAGKCGAAIAADIGARRLTHQLEAMRSLGANPDDYLYGNMAIAMVIGAPVLGLVAYVSNTYSALLAYLLSAEDANVAVFYRHFLVKVWPDHGFPMHAFIWVVVKLAASGLLIAAIGYRLGCTPKASATDVSRDVGRTIFWATLSVLLLHSTLAFVEF